MMSTYPPSGYGPPAGEPPQQPGQGSGPYPDQPGYGPPAPSTPTGPGLPAEPAAAPPRKSRAPLIVGIVLGLVLLCCGGGIGAFLLTGDDEPSGAAPEAAASQASPKADGNPKASGSPNPSEETVEGDLDRYQKGDCLTVDEATDKVEPARCGVKGAYQVLLRKNGTTGESACESTEYTMYLYQDSTIGTARDFVLCVGPA
ncbi:LppU/SCO3897 family protein [Plantactinospora sp. CA-290183]|uniref:LppU/SCO3897 family protein n=1 Tax=Plantactinospora sp. CA-290183 TaxID=3240006 RepID=UPI003D90783B